MALISRLAIRRAAPLRALTRAFSTQHVGGVEIIGVETGTQPAVSRITLVAKAGSRHETTPGVAHVLKNFAFKTTTNSSALRKARESEMYGGSLSSAVDRENIYLTAECLQGDEQHFIELLADVAANSGYPPHEYNELVLPAVQAEAQSAAGTPAVLAIDAAHKLAFRRGLGNSLFASPYSPVTIEAVSEYAKRSYAKNNLSLIGTGISTERLAGLAKAAFGSGKATSAPIGETVTNEVYGGEQRIALDPHSGPAARPTMVIAWAMAGRAPGPAEIVLPYIFGGQTSVKWNYGTSPLSAVVEKYPGASIEPRLYRYPDAALLTFTLQHHDSRQLALLAKEAGAILSDMDESRFSAEALKKAIARAKYVVAAEYENPTTLVPLLSGLRKLETPELSEALKELDKVDEKSVLMSYYTFISENASVVTIGDLSVLPYADEIIASFDEDLEDEEEEEEEEEDEEEEESDEEEEEDESDKEDKK